ncbi:MAG: hypothetical protein AAFX09_03435 [Pseudomonadota bacterium]
MSRLAGQSNSLVITAGPAAVATSVRAGMAMSMITGTTTTTLTVEGGGTARAG